MARGVQEGGVQEVRGGGCGCMKSSNALLDAWCFCIRVARKLHAAVPGVMRKKAARCESQQTRIVFFPPRKPWLLVASL